MIVKKMKVYVDDIVVKLANIKDHLVDLETIFDTIWLHHMHLNLEKCFFGVKVGKFLGFMIMQRGIEANHDKCEAVLSTRSPQCLKEVQRLNEKVVTLSRFLPRGWLTKLNPSSNY